MSEQTQLGGTDGFRGPATLKHGPGLINEETFALATYALVERQLEHGEKGPLIIGQDTRESGTRLRHAAISGALMHGVEVWDMGIAPTPALQKVCKELGGMATVAITASHNPAEDNGWKGMVGSDKPTKEVVADISRRYWGYTERGPIIMKRRVKLPRKLELLSWYEAKVINDIQKEFGDIPLEGKLFVVDGANGAAQGLTAEIFRCLGAQVEEFSCGTKGRINDGCGAADLSGLKNFLTANPEITNNPNFVGAVANDGDADRVMSVGVLNSNEGPQLVEVNGNHLMGSHALGQTGIAGTEYTNSGLVQVLKAEGIGFEYCANGDVFVTQKLREKQADGEDWTRGGEFTGHHIDTNWLSSGDGIRMAAWFAAFAASHDLTFGEIYSSLPLWNEKMSKVRLPASINSASILESQPVKAVLAKATDSLASAGRLVVRASGTEPVIRIWGEGKKRSAVETVVNDLETAIRNRLDK